MTTKITPFQSVLVANRGEIACRIIRSAKQLGLRTIAIYSEADASASHVKMADEAVLIGPGPINESYLSIPRLLDAIKLTSAEAVHPGYGFLSENAEFANACEEHNVVFVGPPVEAIDIMGDKAKAKRRMLAAGVPCIPGYQDEDQSDETLIARSADISYPIMVKAAAGGGGRGMRLVQGPKDILSAIQLARSEAKNAFDSDRLILEHAILKPRHVEIQIFADKYGNIIHLGERDCSVQRRHQKIIEEAPCPVMTPDLRDAMGAAAARAAKDVSYVGAGTVEFLLDSDKNFYFLEMNTRLQVEHPVTEMVTGLDLVAMQFRTARGEPLGLNQIDVHLSGHAIEARLYAENPAEDFLPTTGSIDLWQPPNNENIRIEAGIQTGDEISPYYDPMIAKIIAHGDNREEARTKLITALKTTGLFGVASNQAFLIDALEHPHFVDGKATTAFIAGNYRGKNLHALQTGRNEAAIGAALLFIAARGNASTKSLTIPTELLNWTSATPIETPYKFSIDDDEIYINVSPLTKNVYRAHTAKAETIIEVISADTDKARLKVDDTHVDLLFNFPASDSWRQTIQFNIRGVNHILTNLNGVIKISETYAGAGAVIAPMHGLLLDILVKPGDKITKGDKVAILEAMKMQHELLAEIDGVVSEINFKPGTQIPAGAFLLSITTSE